MCFMTSEEKKVELERITNEYFKNGGAKISRMSDSVLKKIGFVANDPDEFYSLAGEVFLQALDKWDGERKFDSLLYACLSKRFKSFLTKENAQKRGGVDKPVVSLYQELGEDLTLEDTIGEEQVIDRLSPEMIDYVKSLNSTQKKILLYLTEGYEPREIQKKLGITSKVYNRELRDAKVYEKIRVLGQSENAAKVTKKPEVINKGGKSVAMSNGRNEMTAGTTTVATLMQEVKCGTLRDDNPLQRATDNWNTEMKGNLIVTALNGFGIPGIVVCQRKIGDTYVKEIIDGLQRFSTFAGYISNGYRISKKVERPFITYSVSKGVDESGLPVFETKEFDVRGKKYQDLPEELQIRLTGYNIHCDTYLQCSNEDVEYHIRRLNSSRSMNHSQRGLTFVGTTLAMAIKRIGRKDFFRDTYKTTDFKNGNVQRLISESVMLINFEDEWIPSPEKIGSFLGENAKPEQFEDFGELVDRVDEILDDNTRKLFNMRDSFLWFRIFNDFTRLGIDDEKFNDFLVAFDSLKETEINGETFSSLNTKNTKAASAILKKIDYIETLMYKFFGEEKEEEIDLKYDDEVERYVEEFYEAETEIPVSEKNRAKVAIKTAFALKGKEDLSDSSVQKYLDDGELTFPDLEDGFAFTQDFCDDWAINVDQNSSILKEDKLPALVRLYKYAVESEVDDSRAQNWFINFADQEAVNKRLVGNYQKDFALLRKEFDNFAAYEKNGIA